MKRAPGGIVSALLLAGVWSAPVLADPCKGPPGAFLPACLPPPQREADRAEQQFWRKEREKGTPGPYPTLPPPVPYAPGYIPGPWSPTKTGPMTLEDLKLRPDGKGGLVGSRPGYRFGIDRDGTIRFDDRPPVEMVAWLLPLGFVGIFDLTDIVMRLQGADPYTFDKFRVLELTQDMRGLMAKEDRALRIKEALSSLPARLAGIWRNPALDASERRALLFRLWDESLEPLDQPGMTEEPPDEAAAREGRRIIERFVRRSLPPGSPEAFSPSELTTLNAKRSSHSPFAPYRPAPSDDPPSESGESP